MVCRAFQMPDWEGSSPLAPSRTGVQAFLSDVAEPSPPCLFFHLGNCHLGEYRPTSPASVIRVLGPSFWLQLYNVALHRNRLTTLWFPWRSGCREAILNQSTLGSHKQCDTIGFIPKCEAQSIFGNLLNPQMNGLL